MPDSHTILLVVIIAAVTALLRFLPFIIFNGKTRVPAYITYLGEKLPYAIMGMLIVYCLRSVSFEALADWVPSVIGVAAVIGLHVWKRNTLLSIVGGTLLYMFLVQSVF